MVIGTAALIGAMSLNGVFGMLLMHPVELHLKDRKEVLAERQAKIQTTLSPVICLMNPANDGEVKNGKPVVYETTLNIEPSRWSSLGNLRDVPAHQTLLTETLRVLTSFNFTFKSTFVGKSILRLVMQDTIYGS